MQYRKLGKTGWDVSVVGFGAWGVGGQWGEVERTTAIDTVRAAHDAGVNFFDVADNYGEPPGVSETLIGEALRPVRNKVIIATKAGMWAARQGFALPFTTPLHIYLCCDASLYRLKTDYIDLYQCHIGTLKDPSIFLEAFEHLKAQGKIRAYGISTDRLDVLERFNRDGTCASVQCDYSYLNRAAEKELLPWCREHNVGVIVRGPLNKGVCAGKFTRDTQFTDSVREKWNHGQERERLLQKLAVVDQLRWLQTPHRTLAQAALQFAAAHPAVSTVIPGAKTRDQARANAAAGNEAIPPQELDRVMSITAA